jgi:hypothetical protein
MTLFHVVRARDRVMEAYVSATSGEDQGSTLQVVFVGTIPKEADSLRIALHPFSPDGPRLTLEAALV